MKSKLLISIASLAASAVSIFAAPPFQTVTWPLSWNQPTNQPILSSYVPATNSAYKVYGTTTAGGAYQFLTLFTNWTLVTNGSSILLSNNVTLPFASQFFFFVNPTNVWGEPPFSLGFGSGTLSGPIWSTVSSSLSPPLGQ